MAKGKEGLPHVLNLLKVWDEFKGVKRSTAERQNPTHPVVTMEASAQLAHLGGYRTGMSLYPWQRRAVQRFHEQTAQRQGLCVADRMGYGKTVSAIVCACLARAFTGRRTVLFVVPNAVESQWEEKIREFTTWERVVSWRAVKPAQRAAVLASQPEAIIISQKALSGLFAKSFRAVEFAAFQKRPDSIYEHYYRAPGAHPLFGAAFASIVFDESHILRNPKTGLYAAGMFAGRGAASWLCLSGTPHQNHMADFVSQMRLCHGSAEYQQDGAFTRCSPEFMTRLHATSLIRATEPLPLPPLSVSRSVIAMPADEGAVLDRLLDDIIDVMENFVAAKVGFSEVLAEFMKIRKASVSTTLLQYEDGEDEEESDDDEDAAKPRKRSVIDHARRAEAIVQAPSAKILECLGRLRSYVEQGRKVVVFCSFVDPLFAMADMFGTECCDVYYGGLSHTQKNNMVARFNTDPAFKVMFVSLMSGGTGLNLQTASAAIHLDKWWNPSVEQQATGRIWRLGQTRDCVAEHIEYDASFDDSCSDLYHSFKNSNAENLLAGTYDQKKGSVKFDGSAAANLIEQIATRRKLGLVAARAAAVCRRLQPEKKLKENGASNGVLSQMRNDRQKKARADMAVKPAISKMPESRCLVSYVDKKTHKKTSTLQKMRAKHHSDVAQIEAAIRLSRLQRGSKPIVLQEIDPWK